MKNLLAWWLALLVACSGNGKNAYIVEGVVVEVDDGEVVLDHEDIEGLMPAMVMSFDVAEGAMPANLEPGHKVIARYLDAGPESRLDKIRITGKGPAPKLESAPVKPGETWPAVAVPVHDPGTVPLGEGQGRPVLLTFIYTRCPLPEACPAIVSRYLAVQEQLGDDADAILLAVTLDPPHDTLEVLAKYARDVGATERWKFGRVEADVLAELARRAGMNVMADGDQIAHGLRVIALDREGRLVQRYDDLEFELDRVLAQIGAAPEAEGAEPTP